MLCLIDGDSIATRPGLGGQFPQCEVRAVVGLPSGRIAATAGGTFEWTVISAGSNDPTNPQLRENLEAIRSRIHAEHYVWFVPRHSRAAWTVQAVAAEHGDCVVHNTSGWNGPHPRSYGVVAGEIRRVLPESRG